MAVIIGLTGKNAAGKSTVAGILKKKGFYYFSLSDAIRDEADRQGKDHSRHVLIAIGNELRQKFGPSVLADRIIEKIKAGENKGQKLFVVDSIRNPAEINALRRLSGFQLWAIDADAKLRYKRARARGRNENAKTFEEFLENERTENSSSKNAQQLDNCMKMADFVIVNDSSIDDLDKKLSFLLANYENFVS